MPWQQGPGRTLYRGGLGTAMMEQSPGTVGLEPACPFLAWSAEEVAQWVVQLGFPQYEECFRANGVTGRRLILVNCSNLPAIGVKDFSHMQEISRHVRELLGIEEPAFSRSIALPYRDNMGLFLERKSWSGKKADALTFSWFVKEAGLEPSFATSPDWGRNRCPSCITGHPGAGLETHTVLPPL